MNTRITNSKITEEKPPVDESKTSTGPMYRTAKKSKEALI
jgi:hypothetical protein